MTEKHETIPVIFTPDNEPYLGRPYVFNHVMHGDPIGASFNTVDLGGGGLGYSVGKVLDAPSERKGHGLYQAEEKENPVYAEGRKHLRT